MWQNKEKTKINKKNLLNKYENIVGWIFLTLSKHKPEQALVFKAEFCLR